MPTQTLNFGLIMLPDFQWLDAAGPVDLINNHSHAILKVVQAPESILAKAPIINWFYLSHDLVPVQPTSGAPQQPTATYGNCPPLDYLIVPGPDPAAQLPPGCAEFLKARFGALKALITICTGSIAVSQTGLLDGLNVCSNKVALGMMAKLGVLNRNVKWVGDRRWIVDGKVWSSAGITAGMDLAAEFARVHFDEEIIKIVNDVAEFEKRPDQPDAFARLLEGVKLD